MDTLSRLDKLEATYDGSIPAAMLAVAQHGSPEAVALLGAEANADFYRRMVRGQVEAIRGRREDGSYYPAMLEDLRYYVARWRVAMKHARELRCVIARFHPQASAA